MTKPKDSPRMRQVVVCTWCRSTAPVRSRMEADLWLRTHPCSGVAT